MRWSLVCLCLCITTASADQRLWKDVEGRTVKAELVRVEESKVILKRGEKTYKFEIAKLSEGDQRFIEAWQAKRTEQLKKMVGGFESFRLTNRAYDSADDYLAGDLFQNYLKRTPHDYRAKMAAGLEYKIADQTAALYVPPNYDESKPFGVYVEVPAPDRLRVPFSAHQLVYQKHELLYITPHGAGNSQVLSRRLGLALDALASVKAAYRVDPKRCYIGGTSGGGITSTMVCFLRPEHFQGAVNIVRGALLEPYTLEKDVQVLGASSYKAGTTYQPFIPGLERKHITLSRRYQDKRWAFVAGEKDFNYEFTKASGPQWKKHGYNAKYFHVPGMGHTNATPETLNTVLTWMRE